MEHSAFSAVSFAQQMKDAGFEGEEEDDIVDKKKVLDLIKVNLEFIKTLTSLRNEAEARLSKAMANAVSVAKSVKANGGDDYPPDDVICIFIPKRGKNEGIRCTRVATRKSKFCFAHGGPREPMQLSYEAQKLETGEIKARVKRTLEDE